MPGAGVQAEYWVMAGVTRPHRPGEAVHDGASRRPAAYRPFHGTYPCPS